MGGRRRCNWAQVNVSDLLQSAVQEMVSTAPENGAFVLHVELLVGNGVAHNMPSRDVKRSRHLPFLVFSHRDGDYRRQEAASVVIKESASARPANRNRRQDMQAPDKVNEGCHLERGNPLILSKSDLDIFVLKTTVTPPQQESRRNEVLETNADTQAVTDQNSSLFLYKVEQQRRLPPQNTTKHRYLEYIMQRGYTMKVHHCAGSCQLGESIPLHARALNYTSHAMRTSDGSVVRPSCTAVRYTASVQVLRPKGSNTMYTPINVPNLNAAECRCTWM